MNQKDANQERGLFDLQGTEAQTRRIRRDFQGNWKIPGLQLFSRNSSRVVGKKAPVEGLQGKYQPFKAPHESEHIKGALGPLGVFEGWICYAVKTT